MSLQCTERKFFEHIVRHRPSLALLQIIATRCVLSSQKTGETRQGIEAALGCVGVLNNKAGLVSHYLCINIHQAMTGPSAALLQKPWVLQPLLPLLLLLIRGSSEYLRIQLSFTVKGQSAILCSFSSNLITVTNDLVPHDINRDIREKLSSQSWNHSSCPSPSLSLGYVAPDSLLPASSHGTRLLATCSRPLNLVGFQDKALLKSLLFFLLKPYKLLSQVLFLPATFLTSLATPTGPSQCLLTPLSCLNLLWVNLPFAEAPDTEASFLIWCHEWYSQAQYRVLLGLCVCVVMGSPSEEQPLPDTWALISLSWGSMLSSWVRAPAHTCGVQCNPGFLFSYPIMSPGQRVRVHTTVRHTVRTVSLIIIPEELFHFLVLPSHARKKVTSQVLGFGYRKTGAYHV